PEEFQYDPVTKTYGDPTRRPEIKSSTIEFIAPSEYMLRPPQPAIYLFLLDVSSLAQQSGYLYTVCNTLMEHLENLPGDARTQVGFIAYNSAIHFYNISEDYNQPHEVTVLDVEDVFLPYPDNLVVNLKECKEMIMQLLKQLPKRVPPEDVLQCSKRVYQTMVQEHCNQAGISKFSGGCMHHIPLYSETKPQLVKTLRKSLERYLTRKIGFEAVMRITYEESLTKIKTVCFQAALLYTSSKAERRIRVHTLCIPVTESLSEVMYAADPQCIVGLLSKMAVDRSVTSSLSDARDAFINATVDIISAFRMVQNLAQTSSKLMVPENLRLLPLYILAMLKHVSMDDRGVHFVPDHVQPTMTDCLFVLARFSNWNQHTVRRSCIRYE
uniref:Sec23/Sec24 trunk domain-containing protein n=1 Tax=Anopheles maculatus TaxID=74869 RepID=A0A182SVY8_9DIPT